MPNRDDQLRMLHGISASTARLQTADNFYSLTHAGTILWLHVSIQVCNHAIWGFLTWHRRANVQACIHAIWDIAMPRMCQRSSV